MQKKQFIPLIFSVKKIIILQKLDLDYIFNVTTPPLLGKNLLKLTQFWN